MATTYSCALTLVGFDLGGCRNTKVVDLEVVSKWLQQSVPASASQGQGQPIVWLGRPVFFNEHLSGDVFTSTISCFCIEFVLMDSFIDWWYNSIKHVDIMMAFIDQFDLLICTCLSCMEKKESMS